MVMAAMKPETHDSDDSGVERSLAHELLSEEELLYFAGQKKKKNKLLSSILPKRSAAKTALDQPLDKPAYPNTALGQVENITDAKPPTDQKRSNLKNTSPRTPNTEITSSEESVPEKTSALPTTLPTKKGSGLKIIGASVVFILLVVVAVIFSLTTSNSSSSSENLAAAKDKPSIELADKEPIATKEIVADNNATATNFSSTEEDNKQSSLSEQKTNQEVVEEQSLQNEESASVSYEDFAKEAQSTLYRDSDY